MFTERSLKSLARKAGIWLELPSEDALKLELKSRNFHRSIIGAAIGILSLPFIPIGFWGQTKRWRLYRAEEPDIKGGEYPGKVLFAERTAHAKHQLEPTLIEYRQSPRRSHKKILHVTATIQAKDGPRSRTIEMPNRRIAGPDEVIYSFFYPGLYTWHLNENAHIRMDWHDPEGNLTHHSGMSIQGIRNELPLIDLKAESRAMRDIAHYNYLTDFGECLDKREGFFGNTKTNIVFANERFLKKIRESYKNESLKCPRHGC